MLFPLITLFANFRAPHYLPSRRSSSSSAPSFHLFSSVLLPLTLRLPFFISPLLFFFCYISPLLFYVTIYLPPCPPASCPFVCIKCTKRSIGREECGEEGERHTRKKMVHTSTCSRSFVKSKYLYEAEFGGRHDLIW